MPLSIPSRRLRVLILAEWYPSNADPAAGVFARDQARAAARDHEVMVLVHDPSPRGGGPGVTRTDEGDLRTVRIRTRSSPAGTPGRLAFLIAAARELRRLRRAGWVPDVIHAHVFSSGLIALLLSRGRYPVLVSEHHSDFIEGRMRGRAAHVARYVLKHAELVCPVSERLMCHLEEFQPEARYQVVPNVVDVDPFLEAAERVAVAPSRGRLLVVALLARQKGVEYLLQALGDLHRARSDFSLDVIGDGPERGRLEALARDLLPSDVVKFHGALPRAEVAAFMARSDVLVVPSIVETFGVVVVEAVAARLPVVATTALPDHELVAGRFGLVVPPADRAALRDAVERMLDDGWVIPATVAASFVRSYSSQVVAERWQSVYGSVARVS